MFLVMERPKALIARRWYELKNTKRNMHNNEKAKNTFTDSIGWWTAHTCLPRDCAPKS